MFYQYLLNSPPPISPAPCTSGWARGREAYAGWMGAMQGLGHRWLHRQRTHSEKAWRTDAVYSGGDNYALGEVSRVSWARFVWPCTIGQNRGIERYFICILRNRGSEGENIRSNKECSLIIVRVVTFTKNESGAADFLEPDWETGRSKHVLSSSEVSRVEAHLYPSPLLILGHMVTHSPQCASENKRGFSIISHLYGRFWVALTRHLASSYSF